MSSKKINININGGAANFGDIVQGNVNNVNYEVMERKVDEVTFSKKVFISYRRSDSAASTGRIYEKLASELGSKNVFKDVYSIPLGSNFKDYIYREVSESDVLLAIMGNNWLGKNDEGNRILSPNDFVRLEILTAIESNTLILPVFVSNSKMPAEDDLPEELKSIIYLNGINVRTDPDFNEDMKRLISSLKSIS